MMRRDMRKFEVITIINSNCLVIPNNSLTHSKSRAIEKARAPALIYGFSCKGATDGAAREEPSLLVLFRVATEVDRRSRKAAVLFIPYETNK